MQVVLQVWGDGPMLRLLPGEFDVGRSRDCHIRLPQNPVSRRHCRLTVGADGATVRDLGSRNHTLVNSQRVTEEQQLKDGDWLAICDTRIRVFLWPDDYPAVRQWKTLEPSHRGVTVSPSADSRVHDSQLTVRPPTRMYVNGPPTRVYVSGPPMLWSPDAPTHSGERALEYDLFSFLGSAAYEEPDGHEGPGLGIPLLLYDDGDLETWGQKLVAFLADWGVPDGTTVSLTRDVLGQGVRHLRLDVPRRTAYDSVRTKGEP